MFLNGNAKDAKAAIFSVEGAVLSDAEKAFFMQANPFGFILFARNCKTPDQLRALTDDLKQSVGRDCPILIDQEGGRVQRLKPPGWRTYFPAKIFGDLARASMPQALDDVRFVTLQMAGELRDAGVNVNCAPVLDVLTPDTHDAIGDRAFSNDPEIVARLGLSVCRNLLAAGITPVIKHLPGHGRATMDSHKDLPHIDAALVQLSNDFKPFQDIVASDIAPAIWGMAAHIVYDQIDPALPSSISPTIITEIIRGEIGFDGLLLSDDLDMEALSAHGDVADRAVKTLDAGCDIALYCAGKLPDMQKIAESVPNLSDEALKRLQRAAEFSKMAA